jgi:hypothetical protein
MAVREETTLFYTCDICKSEIVSNSLPKGWFATIGNKTYLADHMSRPVATFDSTRHFCSIQCFYDWIQRQVERYEGLRKE